MASNQWAGEKAEERTTCGRQVYLPFHTSDILPHLVVAELGAQLHQPAGLAGLAVRQLRPALAKPQQSHTVPERGGDKPAERSQTTSLVRNLARHTTAGLDTHLVMGTTGISSLSNYKHNFNLIAY